LVSSRWIQASTPLIAALGVAIGDDAAANGQTSHQWISVEAVDHLPDGELRDLVQREDLRPALLNGTMFPDGGYAVGHGYGEAAHWEPFQDRYLLWIRANCERPYTDDCARHVAFLLGLRSHGMADQFYDAVYMERSKQVDVDGWASGASMDEATDVAFVGVVEPGVVPESFIPYEPLLSLFEAHGEPVDAETLDRAQGFLPTPSPPRLIACGADSLCEGPIRRRCGSPTPSCCRSWRCRRWCRRG
jgi:hypothetical protein